MCQECRDEEDAVDDEMTALLAQWRAEVETYKGCPTDAELLGLMERAADLAVRKERAAQNDRDLEGGN